MLALQHSSAIKSIKLQQTWYVINRIGLENNKIHDHVQVNTKLDFMDALFAQWVL